MPPELVGQWRADKIKVAVRTEPEWMKFIFTSDSVIATLTIDSNKTASGTIGLSEFKNARIIKNAGNADKTGIAYIIECGPIGKIFPNDR